MNRNLLPVLGLILVLAVSGVWGCSQGSATRGGASLYLQSNDNSQGGIQVSGYGELTLVPDLSTLRLGIVSQEDSVAEAQAEASKAMNKVMAALKAHGVAEKDIQTKCFSISQRTRWDPDTYQEIVIGYEVRNIVSAKIRNMDEVGPIIDAAAEAGGDLTRIEGVSFSVEEPSSYYKELREKAMADAQAKAEQIAEFYGITLGKPTHISEESIPIIPIWDVYYRSVAGEGEIAPTPISAGETELSLSIYVTYAILS